VAIDIKAEGYFDDNQYFSLVLENPLIKYSKVIVSQYPNNEEKGKEHLVKRMKEFRNQIDKIILENSPKKVEKSKKES
jgi:hypothetical protein